MTILNTLTHIAMVAILATMGWNRPAHASSHKDDNSQVKYADLFDGMIDTKMWLEDGSEWAGLPDRESEVLLSKDFINSAEESFGTKQKTPVRNYLPTMVATVTASLVTSKDRKTWRFDPEGLDFQKSAITLRENFGTKIESDWSAAPEDCQFSLNDTEDVFELFALEKANSFSADHVNWRDGANCGVGMELSAAFATKNNPYVSEANGAVLALSKPIHITGAVKELAAAVLEEYKGGLKLDDLNNDLGIMVQRPIHLTERFGVSPKTEDYLIAASFNRPIHITEPVLISYSSAFDAGFLNSTGVVMSN